MKTMKAVIIIATIIASVTAQSAAQGLKDDIFSKFQNFFQNQTKKYQSIEDLTKKFAAYAKNAANIQKLNSKKSLPIQDAAVFGDTQFADLSQEDFASQYLTLNVTDVKLSTQAIELRMNISNEIAQLTDKLRNNIYDNPDAQEVPFMPLTPSTPAGRNLQGRNLQTASVFNWVTQGAVNPPRNQFTCGSCWTFSTVSNIESMYYIKYKTLLSFSEQQLVDCDGSNGACQGGTTGKAFTYVKNNGLSLAKEFVSNNFIGANYPTGYMNKQQTCQYNGKSAVKVSGFYYFSPSYYTEEDLKNYLTNYGPLSVAINANTLQYYTSGIWLADATECDPNLLNHAVNLVGYGTSAYGTPYWILRNSWGKSWGEAGYFRFYRGKNVCGITGYVTQAIVA